MSRIIVQFHSQLRNFARDIEKTRREGASILSRMKHTVLSAIGLVIVLFATTELKRGDEPPVWHGSSTSFPWNFKSCRFSVVSARVSARSFLSLVALPFGRLNDISIRVVVYFRSLCRHAYAPHQIQRRHDTIRDAPNRDFSPRDRTRYLPFERTTSNWNKNFDDDLIVSPHLTSLLSWNSLSGSTAEFSFGAGNREDYWNALKFLLLWYWNV